MIPLRIKTEANVQVSVMEEGDYKILCFDKPVRQIGLSKLEASSLGFALKQGKNYGITDELRTLIKEGFFKEKKRFSDIRSKLAELDIFPQPSSLNVVLNKMVTRGEILREGKPKGYKYHFQV
jgi:hypothetical protein